AGGTRWRGSGRTSATARRGRRRRGTRCGWWACRTGRYTAPEAMSTNGEPISGVVERITFHNLDNGYVVLKVRAPKHRDLVTVVGTLSSVAAGEYVEARGQWVTDRTHGIQFRADELKTPPPHTAEGIAKYLGSGLIKGIGPTYAKRIVELFGDKTLDVIDKSPTFLSEVKGI